MTQYTENYRLELYEGTDKADLTDQYNVSMGILDGAMKGVVDDTDASVAGIRAELATTNSNLNATNINLQALDEKVDSNQTAQAATNLNFQNEIDTLKTTVDAVPGTYATQEALAAVKTAVDTVPETYATKAALEEVKTDVGENTPLVEEHVNYFAQLGVTDEQSATDLHTQIDNTHQAAMSNTAAIGEIEKQLSPWKYVGDATIKTGLSTNTFKAPCYVTGGLMFVYIEGGSSHFWIENKTAGKLTQYDVVLPDGYTPTLQKSPTTIVDITNNTLSTSHVGLIYLLHTDSITAFYVKNFESETGSKVSYLSYAFPVTYTK